MSMGLAAITILVIVIGISMASGPSGLQEVLPALFSFFNEYLIPFLLGIAFLIFIINAIRFFVIKSATEEGRENAKSLALYSIGVFIFILSFWGIINIFTNGLGLDNCGNDVIPLFCLILKALVFPKSPIPLQSVLYRLLIVSSIERHNIDQLAVIRVLVTKSQRRVQLELIHDQLPLAVPCYDLLPVIELTVGPDKLALRALPTPLS
jgi:hypothetical protein